MIKRCSFEKWKVDLKNFKKLTLMLKKNSKESAPQKKSKIFTKEQLVDFWDRAPNTPDVVLDKLISQIGYFGLLRSGEIRKLQFEMFQLKEDSVWIYYDKVQKTTKDLHRFILPRIDEYKLYMSYFEDPKGHFFRTYRKTLKRFIVTPMGKNTIASAAKRIAKFLNLDPNGYGGHTWRRTGATELANSGASTIELKRAGRWKSDNVAHGYVDSSDPSKKRQAEQLSLFDQPIQKSQKLDIVTSSQQTSNNSESSTSISLKNGATVNITFNFH